MTITTPAAATPVEYLPNVSRALDSEVWVKREDRAHPVHGGNKVRKLGPNFRSATARGATDLLTLGAVGSNHVWSVAVHGPPAGLATFAVLLPHPHSKRAEYVMTKTMATDIDLRPAHTLFGAALILAKHWFTLRKQGRRPYWVGPGGTNVAGTTGYVEAGHELARQIDSGVMPGPPEVQFCVLGSGGTVAGLLASKWSGAIGGDIVAVRVYPSRIIGPRYLRRLGRRALDGVSIPKSPFDGFRIDDTQLGNGYGHETEAGLEAQALFAQDGIWLDTTYTAKAAAALMQYARHEGHGKRLLFWYTGSEAHQPSTDLAVEIPGAFRALMR